MKEVKFVHFGDQKLPYKFGFNALEDILGQDVEAWTRAGLSSVRKIVFFGLLHGARRLNVPFEYDMENIGDLIDEDQKAVQTMFQSFLVATEKFTGIFRGAEEEEENKNGQDPGNEKKYQAAPPERTK